MKKNILFAVSAATALAVIVGCAALSPMPTPDETTAVIKTSFKDHGIAKVSRLDQSEMQAACSQVAATKVPLTKEQSARLEAAALATVKYPRDGKWLGDYKAGEKVAQTGKGLQFSDKEGTVNGGNCYACHQISKAELSYGNIGPSLAQYGKTRGNTEAVRKYTWAKIWNSHATSACSVMPRYGDAEILTETQIKDVMALLLDPQSPVNK